MQDMTYRSKLQVSMALAPMTISALIQNHNLDKAYGMYLGSRRASCRPPYGTAKLLGHPCMHQEFYLPRCYCHTEMRTWSRRQVHQLTQTQAEQRSQPISPCQTNGVVHGDQCDAIVPRRDSLPSQVPDLLSHPYHLPTAKMNVIMASLLIHL
jgi:hypothetical protein